MTPNINLRCDYFDHPKTRRLVGLLGRGAEMLPVRLWTYCGMFHARDGRLTGYTEQEIEALVHWWGKAGEVMPALEKVGYAHREADDWCMSDWLEHQGHIEAMKIRNRANAKSRWDRYRASQVVEDKEEDECDGNASGIAKAMPSQCSNPPTYLPTLEEGGRVRGEGVEGGTKKVSGELKSGRFALPKSGGLPVPLYPATAGKMKAQCDEEIRRIKAAAKKEPRMEEVGGMRVRAGVTYEPEAQAAIDAWKGRKEEIERGIA